MTTPELPHPVKHQWRFLAAMVGVAGVLLGAVIVLNLLVDPFGMHTGVAIASLREYSGESGSRTAKAELVLRESPAVVLLGSSRVEVGFDPHRPSLAAFAGNRPALNMGLIGSTVYEADRMLDLALKDDPPTLVVIGLDMIMFNAQRDSWADFGKSRLNPDRTMLEHSLDSLISERATRASIETVLASARGRRSLFDDSGFRARGHSEGPGDAQKVIAATIRHELSRSDGLRAYRYDPSRMEAVRGMIERARDAGAEVVVIVNAVHQLELELIDRFGKWDDFAMFKRDAAALPATVIDFAWPTEYSTEPVPATGQMRWWWEHSHFRREYGDIMLDEAVAALRGERPVVGVVLRPETIDAWLSECRERFLRARGEHPDLSAFIDTMLPQRADDRAPSHGQD